MLTWVTETVDRIFPDEIRVKRPATTEDASMIRMTAIYKLVGTVEENTGKPAFRKDA